ncbi:MAG: amidohydrolase [Bacteroidales bacterium]
MLKYFWLPVLLLSLISCRSMKQNADLIIFNANIHTLDEAMSLHQAMAVSEGKILATGSNEYIFQHFTSDNRRDAEGKFIYPGFIDSHSHFYGYAYTVKTMAHLNDVRSMEEMIRVLKQFRQDHPGSWLAGRGWDQNKFPVKELPDKTLLDKEFPGVPVVLIRVDGHIVLVNEVAIRQLDMTVNNLEVKQEAQIRDGKFTGVFFERTADRFKDAIPHPETENMANYLLDAEKDCFSYGLTTVADAGLSKERVLLIDNLQKEEKLNIRIYAMLDPGPENFDHFVRRGIYQTNRLNIRSIKIYSDGALGSRGACLLQPYQDEPTTHGIMVITPDKMREYCNIAYENGYQINTHCIGDSANRMVLNIYGEFLKGKNDRRWRIEHAQVVAPGDFPLFEKFSVIPAVQTSHATSDMSWAEKRLGPERVKTAYAYKTLLQQNGWLPNGSDFPIEKVNPLLSFYSAVARQDEEGNPPGGFQLENALSREDALKSITIWAAKGCMEENIKGSLETGKYADFVILNEDLLTVPLKKVPDIKVVETFLDGKSVFRAY